ncbi:response regulator [Sphingobium sp. AS12]|nr:response regulator [Sphingobium sp. AS12]
MADDGAAILVVEDEALVRAMAADILLDAGYRIFQAGDAPDALAILEERDDIGAVFTDIEMPGMTGLALAATIRDRWPCVALLITSGRLRPGAGEMPTGADYLAKPYHPDELVAALGSMLL